MLYLRLVIIAQLITNHATAFSSSSSSLFLSPFIHGGYLWRSYIYIMPQLMAFMVTYPKIKEAFNRFHKMRSIQIANINRRSIYLWLDPCRLQSIWPFPMTSGILHFETGCLMLIKAPKYIPYCCRLGVYWKLANSLYGEWNSIFCSSDAKRHIFFLQMNNEKWHWCSVSCVFRFALVWKFFF